MIAHRLHLTFATPIDFLEESSNELIQANRLRNAKLRGLLSFQFANETIICQPFAGTLVFPRKIRYRNYRRFSDTAHSTIRTLRLGSAADLSAVSSKGVQKLVMHFGW
jgi:hypothetical protein